MNNTIKKSIKFASYTFVLVAATAIALIPFLRKDKEFTMNYSPEVRDAMADIPAPTCVSSDDGQSDGDSYCPPSDGSNSDDSGTLSGGSADDDGGIF